MITRLEKLFLFISFFILIATVFWLLAPNDKIRYHLIITGMNRAKIHPFKAKFKPYSGKIMGGAAAMATAIKEAKASFNNDSYDIISLGTELSGTADAFFTKGESIVKIMNALQVKTMLLSNIDFTYGCERLEELSKIASFSFLSSNITQQTTQTPPNWLKEQIIFEISNDIKMGVIGITPINTPNLTPKENIQNLVFEPPLATLKEKVDKMRAEKIQLITLLTQYSKDHLKPEEWQEITEIGPDICIMLDQELEAPSPFIKDGIIVYTISSYNQTKEIDILSIELDTKSKKLTGLSSQRIPTNLADIDPDPAMEKVIEEATEEFIVRKNTIIGSFEADYSRSYNYECPIANFIADAIKEKTGAQIAMQNSGGIQGNISSGTFTVGDLYTMLPFDNKVVLMNLKGEDILNILKISASRQRGVIQVSGLKYSFEHKSPQDYKLLSARLSNADSTESEIVPDAIYKVAINNFLAEGGDNFIPFRNGEILSVHGSQRDILEEKIKTDAASSPLRISYEKRIITED